jgi:hypothetical protein
LDRVGWVAGRRPVRVTGRIECDVPQRGLERLEAIGEWEGLGEDREGDRVRGGVPHEHRLVHDRKGEDLRLIRRVPEGIDRAALGLVGETVDIEADAPRTEARDADREDVGRRVDSRGGSPAGAAL